MLYPELHYARMRSRALQRHADLMRQLRQTPKNPRLHRRRERRWARLYSWGC